MVTDGQRRVIFVPEPDGNGSPHASFGYAVDEGGDVSTELTIAVGIRLELKPFRLSCWRRPSKKPNLQDTGELMSTNPPCIL